MVLYTSGTTGRPKGVLHSHVTLQPVVAANTAHWGLKAGEAITADGYFLTGAPYPQGQ